jgi:hypothetical protein
MEVKKRKVARKSTKEKVRKLRNMEDNLIKYRALQK